MVRNSVGSQCYVADEIITSRAGCRVRVGNTDAEGEQALLERPRSSLNSAISCVPTVEMPCHLLLGCINVI